MPDDATKRITVGMKHVDLGISAWITVGEHSNDEEDPIDENEYVEVFDCQLLENDTFHGFIASEAGQKFAVNWENELRETTTVGKLFLDGVFCGDTVMRGKRSVPLDSEDAEDESFASVSCVFYPDRTRREFVFSQLELTAEETLHNVDIAAIGTIRLEVWKARILRPVKSTSVKFTIPDDKVHESQKKAGLHRVLLGPKLPAPTDDDETIPLCQVTQRRPIVTFKFTYRPLSILKASGIVPSTSTRRCRASTSSASEDEDEDDIDTDEQEDHEIENDDETEANVRPKRKRCSTTNSDDEGQDGHQVEEDDNEKDIKVEDGEHKGNDQNPFTYSSQGRISARERAAAEKRARANLLRAEARLLDAEAAAEEAREEADAARANLERTTGPSSNKKAKIESKLSDVEVIDLT